MFAQFLKFRSESNDVYLKRMVNLISSEHFILAYVDYLLTNKNLLHELTLKSYFHANQFIKLSLFESENYKLRIHYWNKTKYIGRANVHDHRFDCYSYIYSGQIKNIIYRENTELNKSFNEFVYLPRLVHNHYDLNFKGKRKLCIDYEQIFNEGDTYSLNRDVLHKSICLSESAITIFVEDRTNLKDFAKVYSLNYQETNLNIPSDPISEKDFLSNIIRLTKTKANSVC